MSDVRKLKDLSRQQLYDLIWSTPVAQVATDFGVTEATVKSHCNNRRVPRPTRRYWTKIAAGVKPRKKPLPSTGADNLELQAQKRIPKALALPEADSQLHPLAVELLAALNKTKVDHDKRVHLRETQFPEVAVSKPLVARAARAFHVILQALEPLGIVFRKFPGKHDPGYFKWGQDRLFFYIDETLIEASGSEKREDWFRWDSTKTPSGRLAFSTKVSQWGKPEGKEWLETKQLALERVLSEVVSDIRLHFLNKQRQHIQEAIERKKQMEEYEVRHREWLAEEAIREQKEAEQAHLNAIKSVAGSRRHDLIKAAEWWRRSCQMAEFIAECERRWRGATGELNPEQAVWLAWAKEIAASLSPFTAGYPDPAKHGAFDPATVPFGGPYPTAQNFQVPT